MFVFFLRPPEAAEQSNSCHIQLNVKYSRCYGMKIELILPPKHLAARPWSRSHLMYLQLILSHNRCHCNQSCQSTQGGLSSFLTSQSHLYILSSLSYLLSSPSLLDFLKAFLHPSLCCSSFFFLHTDRPPALLLSCVSPKYILGPALQSHPPPSPAHLSLHLFCMLSHISAVISTGLPSPQL